MPPAVTLLDNDLKVDVITRKRAKKNGRVTETTTRSKAVVEPVRQAENPGEILGATNSNKDNSSPLNPHEPLEHTPHVQPDIDPHIPQVPLVKPTMTQKEYLRQFIQLKRPFIDMLISRYARTPHSKCTRCGSGAAFYRCTSCHRNQLHCRGCIRHIHLNSPFHRIEQWNGRFFQRAALWQVGLRLVVPNSDGPCLSCNHRLAIIDGQEIARDATRASRVHSFKRKATTQPGDNTLETSSADSDMYASTLVPDFPEEVFPEEPDPELNDLEANMEDLDDEDIQELDDQPFCDDEEDGDRLGKGIPHSDTQGNKFITIVDSSGMHHLPLFLCNCNFRSGDQQVLDCVAQGLMPASYKNIKTLFTEACLDDIRLSNLEARTTTYQYHGYLRRKTNPVFPKSVPDRYAELRRLSRQWRIITREIWAGIYMPSSSTGVQGNSTNVAGGNLSSNAPSSGSSPIDESSLSGLAPPNNSTPQDGALPNLSNSALPLNSSATPSTPTTASAESTNSRSDSMDVDSHGPCQQSNSSPLPESSPTFAPLSVDPQPLSIFCPACPQPGKNLPAGWEKDLRSFLYILRLVMEGNFSADHLRQKGGNTDVALLDGRGMFAEKIKTLKHLAVALDTRTNAPCEHNFRAIGLSNMSRTDCDVTGIGAAACARHGCICPGSVNDFQKGERQANMDWALCQAILNTGVIEDTQIHLWYDIFCQYCIHLLERIQRNPHLELPKGVTIDGGVGLFHVHGHADQCFYRYASYFVKGAAIVDGEILETLWSSLNQVSRSTRTATLPHREEILDDAMFDSNWKKWVNMVASLIQKYKRAVEEQAEQAEYFSNLSKQADPKDVEQWKKAIELAESKRTPVRPESMDILKTSEARPKSRAEIHYEISSKNPSRSAASQYIVDGLKLEEEQLQLGVFIARMGAYPSKSEKREATAHRTKLLDKIQRFHSRGPLIIGEEICSKFPEQRTPIPVFNEDIEDGAAADLTAPSDPDGSRPALSFSSSIETHAERIFLMLPSGVPSNITAKLTSATSPEFSQSFKDLCTLELELRRGHANDALQDIRNSISRISFQYTKNYRQADRTMIKTRSRTAIDNLHKDISHCRRVYNLCRERLIALNIPSQELLQNYKPITNSDLKISTIVRAPNEQHATRTKLAWFFQTEMERSGHDNNADYLREYLRLHWMRARALSMRWDEELELVKNEMLWTWIFYKKRQIYWEGLAENAGLLNKPGHKAYGLKQAFLWEKMSHSACAAFSKANPDFVPHL